nr:reverse transcriptase domain-containing protein [Tanacetum cinerariifolium]
MPLRVMTQSAGQPAIESLGGGTCIWVGRGRRGRRPREGNDKHVDDLNGQINNYGLGANGGVEGVNGNVEGVNGGVGGVPDFSTIIAQNVLVNGNWVGCSYNELLACNLKEYDESELWNLAMVGAGHAAYTDRFHELARLVPHLVTPESRMIERYVYGLVLQIREMVAATEPKTIQKAVQISDALTDEAVRNGSIKKVKKRGNMGEPSKDKNGRDDNKRTKTVNIFATTVFGPSVPPATPTMHPEGLVAHASTVIARVIWQRIVKVCRGILNRAQGPKENRPNQVDANNRGQGCGNQGNQARGIELNDLGFRYEIEIASGQLVEIDK